MRTIVVTSTDKLWRAAQKAREYTHSTIDTSIDKVGFIHATSPDQTIDMLNRHFADRNDILLLWVDLDKVKPEVKFEKALSGTPGLFPHIYGPLNVGAIYDTTKPKKNSSGQFIKPKVTLFDADGVLTLPEEAFSVVYARSHGLEIGPFEYFFRNEWANFVTGKSDLKKHIENNPSLWRWNGTPDELLDYWFKSEDIQNSELVDLIKSLRSKGMYCYLATEQEKYRGDYMRNTMFKDLFDGYFITAEIGFRKSQPEFFEHVVRELTNKHQINEASDILFFDDSQSKVDAAKFAGLNANLFTGLAELKKILNRQF